MSRALVAAGAKVALTDIDGDRLAEVAKELTDAGGTVTTLQLDVGDADQWSAAADRAEAELGPISILCNVAGVARIAPIEETSLDVWRWTYRVNIEAQFVSALTFLPRFKSRGGRAHIFNAASMSGIVPVTYVSAYSSSKFASVGFSMVLRDELEGTDIGVSVLCPGTMDTRISETSGRELAKVTGEEVDVAAIEANSATTRATGADPNRVAEQVLEAMQKRQFLIVTHHDWEPLVKRVHDEVQRAFDEYEDRYGPDTSAQAMAAGTNPSVF